MRKQKWGNRGGARAKLKANPNRAPLPSILLANIRSLENKLDYLRLEIRDCCVLIFTKTRLNADAPDSAIDMEGLTVFWSIGAAHSVVNLEGVWCACI